MMDGTPEQGEARGGTGLAREDQDEGGWVKTEKKALRKHVVVLC